MGFLDNPAFALNICPESERQPMKFLFDPKPDCDARMLRPDLCPSGGFSLKCLFAPRFFGDPDDRGIKKKDAAVLTPTEKRELKVLQQESEQNADRIAGSRHEIDENLVYACHACSAP